jgi:hypothetical protein
MDWLDIVIVVAGLAMVGWLLNAANLIAQLAVVVLAVLVLLWARR